MTRRFIRLQAAVAAVVLAVGGALLLRHGPTPPADPAAASPRIVVALGRIEPGSEVVTLAPPQGNRSSRIAVIPVGIGDEVVVGQSLAVMDNFGTVAAQVRAAEATLQQKQARLAQRLVEMEIEEATLNAALAQERASRDRAQWEHERATRLEQGGVYKEAALIDKRLALEVAQQRLVAATLALDRAARRDADGRRLEEAVLRTDIALAAATLAQMSEELAMATLRSPINGTVLRINARAGEVAGNDGIMLLGDLRHMRVRAEVFEGDLAGIMPGQKVRLTSRALQDGLDGRVAWVGLRVSRQTMVREDPAATLDARMVEVMVDLDAAGSTVARGLTGLQVRAFFGDAPLAAAAPRRDPPA